MLPSFLRVNRWSADATSRPSSWDPAELPRRYEKPAGNRGRSTCIWFFLRRSGVQRTHRPSTHCAAPQSGWRCRLLVVLGLLNESIPCSEISSGGGHHSAWGGRIPLSPPGLGRSSPSPPLGEPSGSIPVLSNHPGGWPRVPARVTAYPAG